MEHEPEVRLEIALPLSLRQWLKGQARGNGMSMAAYIRSWLIEERRKVSVECEPVTTRLVAREK